MERGTGEVTLTGSFEVPLEAVEVVLLLPLGAHNAGTTSVVSATYPVE